MSDPQNTGPSGPNESEPLSPEALAVLGKARRSFGISIAILLLGFMAIGFALVYRALRDAPPPTVIESVALPAGAEIVSAVINGGEINVTYRLDGVVSLSLFDQETGELSRTVTITAP